MTSAESQRGGGRATKRIALVKGVVARRTRNGV